MQLLFLPRNAAAPDIPSTVIEGHQRYSTRFLLPLMSGIDRVPQVDEIDRNCYRSLNLTIASHLNWAEEYCPSHLHNYEHALVPKYLSPQWAESLFFTWEIGWAEVFADDFREHAAEIARSLLCCKAVAFRTAQDRYNFAHFVREAVPEVQLTDGGYLITHASGRTTQVIVTPAELRQKQTSYAA
jgi:hypothetical protein